MRLALAQINPTVGDISGNAALIERTLEAARRRSVDLVVFPELAICGYPPRDLLHHEGFVEACEAACARIGERCTAGITAVLGTPLRLGDAGAGGVRLANSLVVYRDGARVDCYDKRLLPTYDVFDEDRYFEAGSRAVVIEVGGERVGLAICEDLWQGKDAGFSSAYDDAPDPIAELAAAGARTVVVPSASPFVLGKGTRHRAILRAHATRHRLTMASVNQVGGNDDLIFDGHSCVIGPDGAMLAAAKGFEEQLLVLESDGTRFGEVDDPVASGDANRMLFDALVLGVRDYCRKTGFRTAVLGLSGGIDSALTAAIGAAALGGENLLGVLMPGPYSSAHSLTDARDLGERLGVKTVTAPIGPGQNGIGGVLDAVFGELGEPALGERMPDLTQENLQSRVRGAMVMAISNRTGAIVLTTGNKSELAVGYCTLYGDMNGGLAVLSDVPKTRVFALSKWMNEHWASLGFAKAPIPENTITKPPSAELAPNQKDSDSLPDYEVLDEIVDRHVERRQSAATIARETGFDAAEVSRICRLIDRNEYKRRQMATGLKVTSVAFGPGRRVPIARGWH
jgi:NAD+ synthase (glutamine-hydrolysing)